MKEERKQRFTGEMEISQCVFCVHKFDTGAFCKAFPRGIPKVILSNEFDHTKPFKGDNGIRFKRA